MQSVSLSGPWRLIQTGRGEKKLSGEIPATVPGCVHTDLLAAGVIPDPYYRDNEKQLHWIGWADWQYSRRFDVSADLLARDRVELVCHGLDTLASTRVNGRLVGQTDNMFRTWRFDVKNMLREGENEISVRFDSALTYARRRMGAKQYDAPSREPFKIRGGEVLRKSPYSFGWDWGPKLLGCGIWREMELVGFDTARLDDVHVLQHHSRGRVRLEVKTVTEAARPRAGRLTAEVTLQYKGRTVASQSAAVRRGKAAAELNVTKPKLWWPAGMGDQPMYELTIRLLDTAGKCLDQQTRRIGLRTVEVVRKPDAHGESFYFSVNGRALFAKGANWIPADTFLPAVTKDMYRRLLADAAAANMNMIRVWAGGCYEDDVFYDLCDELGLLVWQDFIFANARYPLADPEYRQNVAAEAQDNIRRLRHHPSLAIWCGNNELELTARHYGESYWPEHWEFFKGLLASIAKKEDPQRFYWPGSPHGGEYNDPTQGDAHTWEVWHLREPFEWYRTAMHRFCSEFGFQSFPEPRTIATCTAHGDRNITSPVMEFHQRCPKGNGLILHYMLSWFRMPKDFASTLWASQLLQALAIEYAVTHWRRHRPRCMGALYWQLNDCWQAASWASIDYFGCWKALHHAARRFFAPLMLSAVDDPATATVDLYVASDLAKVTKATLQWSAVTLDGKQVASGSHKFSAAPDASRRVERVNLADVVKTHGVENLLLFAELLVAGEVASRTHAAFVRPKQMELPDPQITTTVRADGDSFLVTLKARRPALWTWLGLGADAKMDDNFFHLPPGAARTIRVTPEKPLSLKNFRKRLRIRSLIDLY